MDFHNTKQFVSDVYSSPLGSKPFVCDSSTTQGYPTLLDPYLPEQYGDFRSAPLTPGTSSFFSPPSLPPLLPSFPSDTAHFLLVSASGSWPPVSDYPTEAGVRSGGPIWEGNGHCMRQPQLSTWPMGNYFSLCSHLMALFPVGEWLLNT